MKRAYSVVAVILVAGVTSLMVSGCASPQYQTRQAEVNDTVVGAALGGILGGVIGNNAGDGRNQLLGAAIGSALGGWAGNQVGRGQDVTRNRLDALEQAQSTEVVNVRNSNGSYMPVLLRKVGTEYVGPRGEYYNGLPTQEQLKPVYGF